MITYSILTLKEAIDFLEKHKSWKESIELLDTTKKTITVAISKNGVVVGIASAIIFTKTARIRTLYVLKDYRKQAFGSKLIKVLISCLKEIETIDKVTTFATHLGVSPFEKNGFKKIHKRKINKDTYMEVIL